MLDANVIRIVKSTVPVLEVHGLAITQAFYKMLFTNHPELKNVFNQSNQREGKQPMALANAVYAAAANIENLGAILPAVQHIGHKHRSLNVRAEHYPIVGEHLLKAIKEVLGDAATDEIISAWGSAYGVIAQAFIDMENRMYSDMRAKGGWEDFKEFIVEKKVNESEVISSFYLKPKDGAKLPLHEGGQYVSVLGENLGTDYVQPRQYSLSMQPNTNYYRISVKKEDGSLVSKHLHENIKEGDVLKLTAPAGNFTVRPNTNALVLISGGIGITPLLSMLHQYQNSGREVIVVQCVENAAVHAFGEEINALANASEKVKNFVFVQNTNGTKSGHENHFEGTIHEDFARKHLPANADFYYCGPIPFMQNVRKILTDLGHSADNQFYEIFGPAVGM